MQEYVISFLIALFLCLIFSFAFLPLFKKKKVGQEILIYVTEHDSKRGTPTMLGIAIILAVICTSAITFGYNARLAGLSVMVATAYAVVGFLDDFVKIRYRQNQGLKAYQKLIAQLSIAVIVAVFVYIGGYVEQLTIPFTAVKINMGWGIIPFVIVVFLATTNGVNLTDGLDGLAGSVTMVYMLFMAVFIYIEMKYLRESGNTLLSYEYDNLILLCMAVAGSLLGFLVVNTYPAMGFMGDVGSLSLGGAVACVSIFSGMSLHIIVLGIVYVWTCLSVILQVVYFKSTKGKRMFLMAPYHHHLQKRGLSESRIVVIYSAVTAVAGCVLLFFRVGAI